MNEKWSDMPRYMQTAVERGEQIRAAFPPGDGDDAPAPDPKVVLTQAMRAALDSGDWDRVSRVALAIRMRLDAEAAAQSAAAMVAYEARELRR